MDFSELGRYLDSLEKVNVPGCDMIICQDHQEIYRHKAGWRDAARTQPVRGDEVYCMYSCTKVFTTCAVMQLVERGLINLDDPVHKFLPAFADLTVRQGDQIVPAQRVMTIRHLMSMQSGLDYIIDSPSLKQVLAETDGHATTRQIADALAKEPLNFEPGTDFLYSLSHDVLAAVIETVSGMRFSEYLQQNLFDPLGLSTIGFAVTDQMRPRMAAQYLYDEETGALRTLPGDVDEYRLSDQHESGGAGLICGAADYIVFADALACGGRSAGGAQILSPQMIQLWSANQLGPKARRSFDDWNRLGYSYALGVRTRVEANPGGRGRVGEFGWDGAAGSWVMIDPYAHVSAFFAMHVKGYGYIYDVIHPRIRHLIYEGLDA